MWIIAKALEPFHAGLTPKPGELPLRIVPHVLLRLVDCTFERSLTVQIFNHAAIAMGPERARVCRHTFTQKPRDFINQSISKMFFGARIDAGIEFSARRMQREDPEPISYRR